MPDLATAAPTEVKLNPTDVLAASDKKISTVIFEADDPAQNRLRLAQERSNRIVEIKQNNPQNIREALSRPVETPEFTNSDLNNIKDSLSSDETNARVEKAVQDLTAISLYLEASRNAKLNGSTLEEELGTDYGIVNLEVASVLVDRGHLLDKIPDLEEAFAGDKDLLLIYIDELVTQDPKFQKEIADVLTEIHTEATGLKAAEESEEVKRLKEQKAPLIEIQNSFIEQVCSAFGDRLDVTQRGRVKKLLEMGSDPQTVIESLKIELKLDRNLDRYKKLEDTYNQYDAEFNSFNAQASRERAAEPTDTKAKEAWRKRVQNLENQTNGARHSRDIASNQMRAVSNAYLLTHPEIDSEEKFGAARRDHEEAKETLEVGGSMEKLLETAQKNSAKIAEIEAQIKQLEGPATNKDDEKKREELVRQLEGAVDTAMSQYLEGKFKMASERQQLIIDAAQKEAAKAGKTWKADKLSDLKAEMADMGSYDTVTRKIKRNTKYIGENLYSFIKNSTDEDDGTRATIAEVLDFPLEVDKLKKKIAIELTGDNDATYDTLSEEQKIQADEMSQQQLKEFNEIVSEQGENFKKKVFTEYYASRGFWNSKGSGEYSFSKDEVKILQKNFGDLMEKDLQKSGLLDRLKKMGIVPDSKMKLFLYLLVLLGAGAIGTVAAVGAAPAAAAVGVAAKSAGGALWSEGLV